MGALGPTGVSSSPMSISFIPPADWQLGKRAITPAMSIRFGAFFGQSDGFWHGLQVECDFRALARQRNRLIARIRPAQQLVQA
jgi:antitoxin HigA-1